MIGLLETKEETLKFLIKSYLKLSQKKLAEEFEVTEAEMSKIINNQEKKLKNIHLLGFCYLYDLPYEVFDNKKFNTEKKVMFFLENYKTSKEEEIFEKDIALIEDLVGTWYAYVYPSNTLADIYCIETTILEDLRVKDQHRNFGKLLMGERQSIIVKKAQNSRNFVNIVFDNDQVVYGMFPFSMLSKTNQVNREMCNFGFFSRKKLDLNVAQKILGESIKSVQMKIDVDFKERIVAYGQLR